MRCACKYRAFMACFNLVVILGALMKAGGGRTSTRPIALQYLSTATNQKPDQRMQAKHEYIEERLK